ELLAYVRSQIDQKPRRTGQWLFTGSQEAPLMQGVSESMAGRAAILQLLPFSLAESERVGLLLGGFPEVLARPRARELWFSSYVQTYLERDVRAIINVRDLTTYRRFLALAASRHGRVLNKTDLSAPLGVSVPTVSEWLHVLEVTGQIILVPPYLENFGKRLIKSPKLYFTDCGLLCHLLGILSAAELGRSPFLGALFEGFVAQEIIKSQVNAGGRRELYYFRDQQGLEVDFLVPRRDGKLWMIECKAAKTLQPAMGRPLLSLKRSMSRPPGRLLVVHRGPAGGPPMRALAPGVETLDVQGLVSALTGR
ncbi:MAG: ATP-binding protein, partial [Acidobacteria bacterium]|nr:ATP-binding protein [Acidobacteriota bacterium]